jgi:hypothetical protein
MPRLLPWRVFGDVVQEPIQLRSWDHQLPEAFEDFDFAGIQTAINRYSVDAK